VTGAGAHPDFEAVAQLVERIADGAGGAVRGRPALGRPRTIELVHYLGRGAQDRRILVLASYRTGEEQTPALREFATAVRRHELDTEIDLRPLSDPAVADWSAAGRRPVRRAAGGVTERPAGSPVRTRARAGHTASAGGASPPAWYGTWCSAS